MKTIPQRLRSASQSLAVSQISPDSLHTLYLLALLGALLLVLSYPRAAMGSDDYDYAVMARTGQDGLTSIKLAPSINNHGSVACGGNLVAGEGLFFSDGHVRNVTPSFVGSTFSTFIKLIHDGSTVARNGSGTSVYIRRWDANRADTNYFISNPGGGPASVCDGGRRRREILTTLQQLDLGTATGISASAIIRWSNYAPGPPTNRHFDQRFHHLLTSSIST
jgi:hypothetical protein